jgi:hypothetical protein
MFKQGDKIVNKSDNFKIYTFKSYYHNNIDNAFLVYEDNRFHFFDDYFNDIKYEYILLSEYRKLKLEKLNNV